jgi:hypothetical protein
VLHKHMTIVLTVFSAGLALLLSAPTGAHAAGLVDLLTQQLGVTEPQATGGAGAIFTMAKAKLSPQDFGQVAKAVPNMTDLLQAAPKVEGLGSDMIGKFVPIVLQFVESQGGATAKNLLAGVLQ